MSDSSNIICIGDKQPLMCTIFTLCSLKYDVNQKKNFSFCRLIKL